MTGDMTEDGQPEQFEALAEVLEASGVDPERITLVPGNHDLYTDLHAWDIAMSGPLSRWATTSRLGSLVVRDGVAILPISTCFKQHYLFSGGRLGSHNARRIAWAARQAKELGCALVVGMHHPVFPHPVSVGTWWDGLRDHYVMSDLLREHREAFVFHGHIHRKVTKAVTEGAHPQVFCAKATVDSDELLRLYDVEDSILVPVRVVRPGESPALPDFALAAE